MKAATTFAAIVLTMVATAVHADRGSQPTLIVRLYNTAGIPATVLSSARRDAELILHEAGMHAQFRHCGQSVDAEPADRCDDTLQPSEFVVRIIHAPAFSTALHPDAFGLAYVVADTNRGWLATVFSDRIARAAARAGIDPGMVLGRVIAHEVGHLLLGVRYHSDAGVMRAQWPDAQLRGAGDAWRFSIAEAARMHRALATSARSPRSADPSS